MGVYLGMVGRGAGCMGAARQVTRLASWTRELEGQRGEVYSALVVQEDRVRLA